MFSQVVIEPPESAKDKESPPVGAEEFEELARLAGYNSIDEQKRGSSMIDGEMDHLDGAEEEGHERHDKEKGPTFVEHQEERIEQNSGQEIKDSDTDSTQITCHKSTHKSGQ